MSSSDTDSTTHYNAELGDLLAKWEDAKLKQKVYDDMCKAYREQVESMMNERGTDAMEGDNFSVVRANRTITTVSVKDVPADLLEEIGKKSTFYVYTLKNLEKVKARKAVTAEKAKVRAATKKTKTTTTTTVVTTTADSQASEATAEVPKKRKLPASLMVKKTIQKK